VCIVQGPELRTSGPLFLLNFGERGKGEVRRILLLGTRVNKGKKGRVRPHSNATVAEELYGR
jgi:hypothetical protein